jgi:hypothetical protein
MLQRVSSPNEVSIRSRSKTADWTLPLRLKEELNAFHLQEHFDPRRGVRVFFPADGLRTHHS